MKRGQENMKRGQLSAEMLILLVLILALVAIVANAMLNSTKTAQASMDIKTQDSANFGNACTSDSDCQGEAGSKSQLMCDEGKHCAYK
jgi:flagellar basal body-associated protein FliL